jgi:hypothetical protein
VLGAYSGSLSSLLDNCWIPVVLFSVVAEDDGILMFKFRLTKDGRFSGASYFDCCFFGFSFSEASGKLPKLSSPTVDEV